VQSKEGDLTEVGNKRVVTRDWRLGENRGRGWSEGAKLQLEELSLAVLLHSRLNTVNNSALYISK
jgi:hypothetical protein